MQYQQQRLEAQQRLLEQQQRFQQMPGNNTGMFNY
jgi:hypothetical protein